MLFPTGKWVAGIDYELDELELDRWSNIQDRFTSWPQLAIAGVSGRDWKIPSGGVDYDTEITSL
jgi:hypothetical protein